MIPRTIPKKVFIGESVSEASFIASKGIDETKAPTQRDAVTNLKNLEINYDGSLSPRCPLLLARQLPVGFTYIDKSFNGDFICLRTVGDSYEICILDEATNIYNSNIFVDNLDISVINTTSSTIIQNCSIDSELATFKFYILNDEWTNERILIKIDTLDRDSSGVARVNPNLMLSNPLSVRDNYNSYSVEGLSILAYIRGSIDNRNIFIPDTETNLGSTTIKDVTESGEYKIISTLPAIGTNISFNHIILKAFINTSLRQDSDTKYYIRWEKTTDGVYWKGADSSYDYTSGDLPESTALINVPDYVINTNKSITDENIGVTPCLFKVFNTGAKEDAQVIDRNDCFVIDSQEALEYSYRALVYMVLPEEQEQNVYTAERFNIVSIDGTTNTLQKNNIVYYVPDYNSSRNSRSFSLELRLNDPIATTKVQLDPEYFTIKILNRSELSNDFTEYNFAGTNQTVSIAAIIEPGETSTKKISITGSLSISDDLLSYPMDNFTHEKLAIHYVTYVAVYYKNTLIDFKRYNDMIPIKNLSSASAAGSASITLDNAIYQSYNMNSITVSSQNNTDYSYLIKLTDGSSINKLIKLPSSISVSYTLRWNLIKGLLEEFANITKFTISGYYYRVVITTKSSTVDVNLYETNREATSSSLIPLYNALISLFDGTNYFNFQPTLTFYNNTSEDVITPGNVGEYRNWLYSFSQITSFTIALKKLYLYYTINDTKNVFSSSLVQFYIYNHSYNISSSTDVLETFQVQCNLSDTFYVWYTAINSTYTGMFKYTNLVNIDFFKHTDSSLYMDYSKDASTYTISSKYSDSYPAIPVEGFQLSLLPSYPFLRNQTNNIEVIYLDLGTNNANDGHKLYWNHRIVSYGAFNNNILFSDSDSLVTPLLNTLTLNASQDTQITSVVPWRNYLVAATKEAIYLIYEMDDGFGHKAINTFIGIPEQDRRTCKAILNGIIFKSNNKIYTLQPGLYSNDDSVLNIAEISQPIESLLSRINVEIEFDREDTNFAISTSKYYYLFIPGYPNASTTCFKYDYVRRIWTSLEFPIIISDYIQTTEDELYLIDEQNRIFSFESDFTKFVKNNRDSDDDDIPDTDITFGDYLDGFDSPPTPISFTLDSGQKTDNISTTKQFVETKMLVATMDDMDSFPLDVDIYIDGIKFKNIHTDINTDGAVLKRTTDDGLILGTNTTTNDIDLLNTFRQLILRYSGKGKSIRHIISGNTMYNFKIYVTYYRYKLTHNKQ